MSPREDVRRRYIDTFGTTPRVFSAPGRVNIIGEHTDYNDGFVLPAAINKAFHLAIGPAEGRVCRWISADLGETAEVDLSHFATHEQGWVNYLLGVVQQFTRSGREIPSFHAVLSSDIPIGAGLSSSAALESVMALALDRVHGFGLGGLELARMAQRAENQFIGLQCGIMDMFASIHGKKDHALKLDCRSLAYAYIPLELGDHRIMLIDTGVRHSLASSAYNTRKMQCGEGVAILRTLYPEVISLRDATLPMVERCREEMGDVVYRRCRFVVEENERVHQACAALRNGSLDALGQLMYASHQGLQHAYEVSCGELDWLVSRVKGQPGVLGARMMGGGFGGCTINIIHRDSTGALLEQIAPSYREETGMELRAYEVVIGGGAAEFTSPSP
jgi:galactokinase